MNGLVVLYWDGVTDVITVGHNKPPPATKFTPLEVGRACRTTDLLQLTHIKDTTAGEPRLAASCSRGTASSRGRRIAIVLPSPGFI